MKEVKFQRIRAQTVKQVATFVAMVVSVFALVSCERNPPGDPYVSVPDANVTVENVVLHPNDYIGRQVTVAGTVKATFGEQAFLLHGEKLTDELLAIGADPYPDKQNDSIDYALGPVKAVRVRGIVRRFDPTEIERATGVKTDMNKLNAYAGKPVLVVQAIEKAEK